MSTVRRDWLSVLTVLLTFKARAGEPALDELESSFGTTQAITLATGYRQALFEAPSTATVLTAEEFRAFGVRTLRDALELIPGYLISTNEGRDTVTTVRGITSRTLILMDGVAVAGTLLQPFQSYDNILLNNVSRLEVVRGPASSIYGADAVAGVINIITKTSGHQGSEIGASVGSFGTYEGWYLHSFRAGPADVGFYLGGRTTDATDAFIRADSQSALDRRFGTMVSRAPRRLPIHRDQVEARVDVTLGSWSVRVHYSDVFNWQTGFLTALSEQSTSDSRLYGVTVLQRALLSSSWQLDSLIDYAQVDQPAEGDIFPPGAFGGAFPEGALTQFNRSNLRLRAETTALFSGWKSHTLRIGGGGLRNEFRFEGDVRNFVVRRGQLVPTGMFAPRGGVNDRAAFPSVNQDNGYLYIQDQWAIAKDLSLTGGIRADRYSDFGSTVNPRLGIVWNPDSQSTLKLLYGRAFRPPSLFESYSEGVFTAAGRMTIEPTTLESVELSANLRTRYTSSTVTGFVFRQDDLIQIVPDPQAPRGTAYTNGGTETGSGSEVETMVELPFKIKMHGGYAYQERHGRGVRENVNLRFGAPHALNLGLTWERSGWLLGVRSLSLFGRKRGALDSREPAKDYTSISAALTRQNIAGLLDVSLNVRNLLGEDVRDQSDSVNTAPGDIPHPGRSVFITASGHW